MERDCSVSAPAYTRLIRRLVNSWQMLMIGAVRTGDRSSRWRGALRGRPEDPAWARPALLALLLATAVLYLFGLGESGWANSYYSAAVQAATQSWKAFFFGSFDSASYITVDKTPASLWVMALSARVFGLNSWSLLVPQALMGVGTVALVYVAVKRWWGAGGGLLAGAVVAATPVAALMFRYNNPDALLTLLLTASAYATLRAVESGRTRWLLLAGACVGFGFLTKMLQAFIVLPALGLAYLLAAPLKPAKRIGQLALAGAAVLVSAGWWVAAVELWPAAARPYIGGSTTNSILQLTFGYNGLGRITGNEVGAVNANGPIVGNFAGANFGGGVGITRLFSDTMGSEISWLLPAALVALAVGAWLAVRRRDRMLRAGVIVWGGWLLVTGAVFSFMNGIIHPYYNVVLAPAMGALIGMAAPALLRRRHQVWCRIVLAGTVALTGWWSFVLLGRDANWLPWLRSALLVASLLGAAGLLVVGSLPARRLAKLAAGAVAIMAVVGVFGGTTAYALATAEQPHTGAIPSSGPSLTVSWTSPARMAQTGDGGNNGGNMDGNNGGRSQRAAPPSMFGNNDGQWWRGRQNGLPGGTAGGFGAADQVSGDLVSLLQEDASSYTWAAAMTSASNAAPVQLAAGVPILAIGGFNGTDRSITLQEFQELVAQHRIHYYIAGGGFANSPNSGVAGQIASWIQDNYTAQTVGAATVYDLTANGSAI